MPNVATEDLQRAITELKQRLARAIRQPEGQPPGLFADLVGDIDTLEEMARKLDPDASSRGKRATHR